MHIMKVLRKTDTNEGLTFIDNHPIPEISPDEILVKVKAAGICGTDVDIYRSDHDLMDRMLPYFPVTTGHEFAGVVVETGSSAGSFKVGDFVSAEMHRVCGQCINCRTGNGHACINTRIQGLDMDGCFAEYVAVKASNVILIDKSIPLKVAGYLDAIGNAVHTVMAGPVAGQTIAITGCGPMGVMASRFALQCGAERVLATDVNDSVLAIAKTAGAEVFNVSRKEEHEAFLEIAKSDPSKGGVDVVLEMSGVPAAYPDMFSAVRMGGEVRLLGLARKPVEVNFTRDVIFRGITLKGVIGRRMYDTWLQAVSFLKNPETSKLIESLVTHTFPMEDYKEAFNIKLRGEGLKILLYPDKDDIEI